MNYFTDHNGEQRRTDTWYDYPPTKVYPNGRVDGVLPLPFGSNQFYRLRRLLTDGSVDCWPCFGRPAAEPVAWMVVHDLGWYQI